MDPWRTKYDASRNGAPAESEANDAQGGVSTRAPGGSEADQQVHGGKLVRFALLFYGALAIVALGWRVGWLGEPVLNASQQPQPAWSAWSHVVLGLGVAVGVIVLSQQITRHTDFGKALASALAQILGPLGLWQCCVLALASGIGEELFFRGALQPTVGLVAASILFGLVHFVPRRDLISWSVFAVVVGFLLGVIFQQTGSLIAPIVAHVTINAVNLRLLVRDYGTPSKRSA